MWYPFLAQQEVLAERKQAAFLLAESVLMAAPSGSSQVQTVPCWQEIVQATVVLPVLLSQQAFLLLMFPVRARIGLPARGEQPAAFHESAKLDAWAAVRVHQQSVYTPASWAVGYLREEQASP